MDLQVLNGLGIAKASNYKKIVTDKITKAHELADNVRIMSWNLGLVIYNREKASQSTDKWNGGKEGRDNVPDSRYEEGKILSPFAFALMYFSYNRFFDKLNLTNDQIDTLLARILKLSSRVTDVLDGRNDIYKLMAEYPQQLSGLNGWQYSGLGEVTNTVDVSSLAPLFQAVMPNTAENITEKSSSLLKTYNDLKTAVEFLDKCWTFLKKVYYWSLSKSGSMAASQAAIAMFISAEIQSGNEIRFALDNTLREIGYEGTPLPPAPTPGGTPGGTDFKIPENPFASIIVPSGAFDWVGRADFGDKLNYYAGLHPINFNGSWAGSFKVGNKIKITAPAWPEANGKEIPILRINDAATTVVLDIKAPDIAVQGDWENVSISGKGSGVSTAGIVGIAALLLIGLAFSGVFGSGARKADDNAKQIYDTALKARTKTKKTKKSLGKVTKKSLKGLGDIIDKPDLILD